MHKTEISETFDVIYSNKQELKIDRNNILNRNVRQRAEKLRLFAINKNLKYKG